MFVWVCVSGSLPNLGLQHCVLRALVFSTRLGGRLCVFGVCHSPHAIAGDPGV